MARVLLRSPLQGRASKQLMLLAFASRRTCKRYGLVGGRRELGGALVGP
ncbi:MAG: hypothetical protein M3Q60_09095 [Actinomycetota bacterium]|nr:hypothetical protein [Actinomycetota bacterium]